MVEIDLRCTMLRTPLRQEMKIVSWPGKASREKVDLTVDANLELYCSVTGV